MIFNSSIQEIKKFVGGGANVSIEYDSLAPTIFNTAQRHILPWLGELLWEELVTNFSNLSAANQTLLPYVQRPLAMLSMYEYAKIGGIQFGESGIYRLETDQAKTAYKYQENQYKDYMLHNGYEAIEHMQKFLVENKADYPAYTSSEAYTRATALLINYVATFRDRYSKYLSRYTFELIRPIIEEVEELAIVPLLGQAQLDDLKTKIIASTISELESQLLSKLQKAVAHFTVQEATARNWVRLGPDGLEQAEKLEPQSYVKTSNPAAAVVHAKLTRHELAANRFVNGVILFLESNMETFPLYQAYLDAQTEVSEEKSLLEGYERFPGVGDLEDGEGTGILAF